LTKLRSAIAALDASFGARPKPPPAEPSFADLVSDSARRAAGSFENMHCRSCRRD